MKISADNTNIRYTGRWGIESGEAITTAPGGMIELDFAGESCVLLFDTTMNMQPFPHLWIRVDNGAKIEVPVDRVIRIEPCCPEKKNHHVEVIYKGAVEIQHRWYHPLVGKLRFTGAEADEFLKPQEDKREIIEFIGDSITEGVLIDAFRTYNDFDQLNRPYQDDSTATYAYLTAMKLGMKPVIAAYGAVGITKGGCGSVPKAEEMYPYNFEGSPASASGAKLIFINHGANDGGASAEEYTKGYKSFLDLVAARNSGAKIVVLSAFCGAHAKELKKMVDEYNEEKNADIHFIDSTGWIPKEPLHPLRDGHAIVSEHLYKELVELI